MGRQGLNFATAHEKAQWDDWDPVLGDLLVEIILNSLRAWVPTSQLHGRTELVELFKHPTHALPVEVVFVDLA